MKILCEIAVNNRLAPHIKSRLKQSTLAIGLHPPGTNDPQNVFIIKFTSTDKTGTRYKIHRNIEKVFTKFLSDGKTTISFKQPPHDLQIRCDAIQLKSFLQILKTAIEGKFDLKKTNISSLAVTPVPQSSIPVKKLSILTPADYPLKGLPKSLRILNVSMGQINGIRKHRIDTQILDLINLTVLNLSDNSIESIPKRLGELPLVELDLSRNALNKANYFKDWDWCDGHIIRRTLQTLILSDNKLKYFPVNVVNLQNLFVLKLSNNDITRLPFALRCMKTLKHLNLANNKLTSLPNTLTRMIFDTFDISGAENFSIMLRRHDVPQAVNVPDRQPSKLWQLVAQIIITKKLRYTPQHIPRDQIELLERLPFCDCGKLCFPLVAYPKTSMRAIIAKSFICSSSSCGIYFDSVYCSEFCRFSYNKHYYSETAIE